MRHGAVVYAFSVVGDLDMGAPRFTCIAVGVSVDAADRGIDLRTGTRLTDAVVPWGLEALEDSVLADPPNRALSIVLAPAVVGHALTKLAHVSRSAVDQGAQVYTDTWPRLGLGPRRIDTGAPGVDRLAIMPGRTITVIEAFTRLRLRKNSTREAEIAEGGHERQAPQQRLLAIAEQLALAVILLIEHRGLEQPERRGERLAEHHHLLRRHCKDADDARHLLAFTFGGETVLPARIDTAHPLTMALQALHQLVRRCEPALPVFLPLAGSLLIADIDVSPLASADDGHALVDAKVITAPCAHAAKARRLIAVTVMPHAHASTSGFAGIDVVAPIASADGLEHTRAVTPNGTRNAPVGLRIGRKTDIAIGRPRRADVAHEAIDGRHTRHRRIAPTAV